MLYDGKSLVAGMSSHPNSRCFLSSIDTPRPLPERRPFRPLALTFNTLTFHGLTCKSIAQIPYIAGGSYGDFRPD